MTMVRRMLTRIMASHCQEYWDDDETEDDAGDGHGHGNYKHPQQLKP